MKKVKAYPLIIGAVIGFLLFLMEAMGNPENMGLCVTSFLADTMGAIGLISKPTRMYIRPEISSIIYGAFLCSLIMKQLRPRGGSSTVIRFSLGALISVGSTLFMGDPVRMLIRMASGDLNAYIGFLGFVGGTAVACMFMIKGFDLGRAHQEKYRDAIIFPLIFFVFLVINVRIPGSFGVSTEGIGAIKASKYVSAICGYAIGILIQRAKFDLTSGVVDALIAKNWNKFLGCFSLFGVILICKLINGQLNFGFNNQPWAHSSVIWNFAGMFIVGMGCCFLGGTPLRMLVLASEGDTDAAISVFGMMFGVACSYGMGFYGSATPEGPSVNGKIMAVICIICLLLIGFLCTIKIKPKAKKKNKKDNEVTEAHND